MIFPNFLVKNGMRNNLLCIILTLMLIGCNMSDDIAEAIQRTATKSNDVFQGNRSKLILAIKTRYKAEVANASVSWSRIGSEESEWVSVNIHNGEELSEAEELFLAKVVYRQMDTSLVNGDMIEIVQSTKKGSVIRFSTSSSNRYAYYELDPNVPKPKVEGEEEIDVEGVLDSLITLNENSCNTKFYKGLLNSWNGNIDEANKDFLSFETCNMDRNGLGNYGRATNYMVLLINENNSQEEIKDGVEFLIPGLDSLQYDEYSLFGKF